MTVLERIYLVGDVVRSAAAGKRFRLLGHVFVADNRRDLFDNIVVLLILECKRRVAALVILYLCAARADVEAGC